MEELEGNPSLIKGDLKDDESEKFYEKDSEMC